MIESYQHTESGYQHNNEDAVIVQRHSQDQPIWLCSLADGQGGQFGGARAAQVAVQKSIELANATSSAKLRERESWQSISQAADQAVCQDNQAGYATLINLSVIGDIIIGNSAGDSGALLLSYGRNYLLTENQCKNPPVGSSAAQFVTFSIKLAPVWKLLVMSDGVWKYLGWELIGKIAAAHQGKHQGKQLIDQLREAVAQANNHRLPDDFTIALLQSHYQSHY